MKQTSIIKVAGEAVWEEGVFFRRLFQPCSVFHRCMWRETTWLPETPCFCEAESGENCSPWRCHMWLLPDVFSFLFLCQLIVGLRLKFSGCILSGVPTPAEPHLKSLFVVLMSFGVFLCKHRVFDAKHPVSLCFSFDESNSGILLGCYTAGICVC